MFSFVYRKGNLDAHKRKPSTVETNVVAIGLPFLFSRNTKVCNYSRIKTLNLKIMSISLGKESPKKIVLLALASLLVSKIIMLVARIPFFAQLVASFFEIAFLVLVIYAIVNSVRNKKAKSVK